MATGDVYQLQQFATFLGQVNMNVLAFETLTGTDPTQAQAQTLANEVKDINRTSQSTSYSYAKWRFVQVRGLGVDYVSVRCRRQGGRLLEGTYPSTPAGSDPSAEILPPQCAFVTTLRSSQIGRSRRGRIYVGGFTESTQVAGVWSGVMLTTITANWGTFMAKYNSATGTSPDFRLVIWSNRIASGCKQQLGGGMTPDLQPHPELASAGVESVLHRTTVFTQRRRVVGVGL